MNNQIGNRIRTIRKSLGLSMQEFGKLFNPPASKGVVSNWENNYNKPNNERLKTIANLGGVSVDELLYGDERSYINPMIIEIAAKQYNVDISDDQEMINHIYNRLHSDSFDSTEETLFEENKDTFDSILLYPFDLDSEGLIQISTLDLFHTEQKIKELVREREEELTAEEKEDLKKTESLILEILEQAKYDIEGIETNPKFSSVLKAYEEHQKEIDQNANKEILDPKHD